MAMIALPVARRTRRELRAHRPRGPAHDAVTRRARCDAERSRAAAAAWAAASGARRQGALRAMAHALARSAAAILEANREDVCRAEASGMPPAMLARLRLSGTKLERLPGHLEAVAAMPDPLGSGSVSTRPNGLRVERVRVPLGVIGVIYESRPDVTVDAAALALGSGNTILLRGGREIRRTQAVMVEAMRAALCGVGMPEDGLIAFADDVDRCALTAMLGMRGLIDLLVPRGGGALIRRVAEGAKVPVLETGEGNCHVYVHRAADLRMAVRIAVNAKAQNPSVCNAAETLLVDRDVAARFLPDAGATLARAGVSIRACPEGLAILRGAGIPGASAASEDDWRTEYLDLILAVKVVDDLGEAVAHIARYGTHHSEAIVTDSQSAAETFTRAVDAAAVYVNASTRFTDGAEFGLGAEIGISTQKLHARGPVGLGDLTTVKHVVTGAGQVRT